MNIGTIVQIGLGHSAEYAYLSQPNWQDAYHHQDPLKRPPPKCLQTIEKWQYFGIDANIGSVDICSRDYGSIYRQWAVGFIRDPEALAAFIKNKELKKIDVLAVDIEGSEKDLFCPGFEKRIPIPIDFIAVEYHPQFGMTFRTEQEMIKTFLNAGYHRYHREPTNLRSGGGWTIELQWIKSEIGG